MTIVRTGTTAAGPVRPDGVVGVGIGVAIEGIERRRAAVAQVAPR